MFCQRLYVSVIQSRDSDELYSMITSNTCMLVRPTNGLIFILSYLLSGVPKMHAKGR